MIDEMAKKDYDLFDMFCFGGTQSIFEVESLRDKVVYLDDHSNIVLTDAKLVQQIRCVSRKWDKHLIIDKIEAAGLNKGPSLINEKALKEIFEINDGRLYISVKTRMAISRLWLASNSKHKSSRSNERIDKEVDSFFFFCVKNYTPYTIVI